MSRELLEEMALVIVGSPAQNYMSGQGRDVSGLRNRYVPRLAWLLRPISLAGATQLPGYLLMRVGSLRSVGTKRLPGLGCVWLGAGSFLLVLPGRPGTLRETGE